MLTGLAELILVSLQKMVTSEDRGKKKGTYFTATYLEVVSFEFSDLHTVFNSKLEKEINNFKQ